MYIYIFDTNFWAYFFNDLTFMQQIQMVSDNYLLWFAFSVILGVPGWALWKLLAIAFEKKPDITHGSAAWGTIQDAAKAGLIMDSYSDKKTVVGRLCGKILGTLYHTLIVAKTRGGKGVGFVIPNLLKYKGSFICNDLKGENYCRTHRQREKLGNQIFKFDPYEEIKDAESHGFNPFDYIKAGDPEAITLARQIADIIASPQKDGDAFFVEYGKKVLTMWILYVCAKFKGEERSLATVRKLITLQEAEVAELLKEMQEMDDFDEVIKRNANKLLELRGDGQKKSDTLLSIYATADTMTAWLDDTRVAKSLSKSDFALEMFRYEPSTLYIVVSPKNLDVSQMMIKIIYTIAIQQNLTMEPPLLAKEQGLKMSKYPLKFLMDEFAQLEKFEVVKKAMPISAGYGIWFIIIIQGIQQLRDYYGDGADEFLTNCTKIFVGAEEENTARKISEMCGKKTEGQISYTEKPVFFGLFTQKVPNHSTTARDLITVGEAIQMPVEKPIFLTGSVKPLKIDRITYWDKDPDFAGLFDPYDSF